MQPIDAFIVLQLILVTLGLCTNISFGLVTATHSLESRVASLLITSQSGLDTVICFINLIMLIAPPFPFSEAPVIASKLVCHIWINQFLYWLFVQMSVQNLVCTALDRYLAVCHAASYKSRQHFLILFFPLYVVLFSLVTAFPVSLESRLVNGTDCRLEYAFDGDSTNTFFSVFVILWFVSCYLYPTIFFICTYYCVIRAISKLKSSGNHSMRKFTISTTIITFFFIVLFSYDTTYYLLGKFVVSYIIGSPTQKLGVLLITMNSCINPIIYIGFMKSMRRKYTTFYSRWFCFCCSTRFSNSIRSTNNSNVTTIAQI